MANPYDKIGKVPTFRLTSTDLADGERLALAQVGGRAGGKDVSPELSWSGFPAETKSFVVSTYDPDAPTASGFWHWVVVDIPASVTSLASGAGDDAGRGLPSGAWQAKNDAGARRYLGASPPKGHGRHAYYTAVHALDVATLGLDHAVTPAVVMFTLRTHTLARAVISGWWETT